MKSLYCLTLFFVFCRWKLEWWYFAVVGSIYCVENVMGNTFHWHCTLQNTAPELGPAFLSVNTEPCTWACSFASRVQFRDSAEPEHSLPAEDGGPSLHQMAFSDSLYYCHQLCILYFPVTERHYWLLGHMHFKKLNSMNEKKGWLSCLEICTHFAFQKNNMAGFMGHLHNCTQLGFHA